MSHLPTHHCRNDRPACTARAGRLRVPVTALCAAVATAAFGAAAQNASRGLPSEPRTGELARQVAVEPGNCSDLDKLRLINATVGSATGVTRGQTYFCRVAGVARPTADSYINFELWLPSPSRWNGKLYSSSGGGGVGAILHNSLDKGLARNYASMSTDRGHAGRDDRGNSFAGDSTWALGHPEKIVDWAERAQHVSTVASKVIIAAYYGRPARYAYLEACSTGGHLALLEAERFPQDFDGIIAAAPGIRLSHNLPNAVWSTMPGRLDEQSKIPAPKLALLNSAVIRACDEADGLEDGLIGRPLACQFDPGVLECKAGDAANCLTGKQVAYARKLYAGMTRKDGRPVAPGYGFPPGSERLWSQQIENTRPTMADDYLRYFVYGDSQYDVKTFDFDRDFDAMLERPVAGRKLGELLGSSADLEAYRARGGKLLIWVGGADILAPPGSIVAYHEAVARRTPPDKVPDVMRLFLAPGVAHCGGGEGPNTFDMLGALESWVEDGQAPERIVASSERSDGSASRTMPLCLYPRYARYSGRGDTNKAENFSCVLPDR